MPKKSKAASHKRKCDQSQRHYASREKLRQLSKQGDIEAMFKLQKDPRNRSHVRAITRCNICKRPHSVYKKFGLCRICLRKFTMLGKIPGARKSSWG